MKGLGKYEIFAMFISIAVVAIFLVTIIAVPSGDNNETFVTWENKQSKLRQEMGFTGWVPQEDSTEFDKFIHIKITNHLERPRIKGGGHWAILDRLRN
jgi:hypothetical protein